MVSKRIIRHLSHIHHNFSPHHHEGRQYRAHALSLISLFIYLQVFVATAAGFYFIKTKAPGILGAVTYSAEQIVALTNSKRAENGLGALSFNGQLAQAASLKASNMFSENYWAHNSPSGKTPWSFINVAGYKYVYAGENLARDFNDANSVVNAWMNSPSHRSNLLDKNFKEIGVAVASGNLTGNNGILVVQMFGTSASQVPTQKQLAVIAPTPSTVVAAPLTTPTLGTAGGQASPTLSPSPVPTATPLIVAQNNQIVTPTPQEAVSSQATVLASRQFSIAKGVSFGLVGFVFLLFAVEVVMVAKKEDLKLRRGVLAHLGILAFVLLVIWYAVSGAIL